MWETIHFEFSEIFTKRSLCEIKHLKFNEKRTRAYKQQKIKLKMKTKHICMS